MSISTRNSLGNQNGIVCIAGASKMFADLRVLLEGKQATHQRDVAMCRSERVRKDNLQALEVVAVVVKGLCEICQVYTAGVEVSSPDGCT